MAIWRGRARRCGALQADNHRMRVEVHPLTAATWDDLERLFGQPGGGIVRGCWCMYYRLTGPETRGRTKEQNKDALHRLAASARAPGLVGYVEDRPVGWISLGPRADYRRLARSPIMKPVDDAEVWSIICTYVVKPLRGKGIQHQMLAGAIDYARGQAVRLLEAYPIDKDQPSHPDFMFFGSRALYERAGFREVERRSPTRVVMRRALSPSRRSGSASRGNAERRAGSRSRAH
jgi:GNAT superfamily N-acetyltransferase